MKQLKTLYRRVMMTGLIAGLGMGGSVVGAAQAPTLVPEPIVATFAGVPGAPTGNAAATAAFCANGANYLTFHTNTDVGDGCPPTQASFLTPTATAEDAYGNIYIADYGDRLIRVVYHGGAALTAALIASSPNITNFSPVVGNIYTLAGGATTTLSQTGSPTHYYCNQAGTGLYVTTSNGDGCPGTEAYVEPRGMVVDANGNIFFANLAGGEGLRVFFAGPVGGTVQKLIQTENPTLTSVNIGAVYSITGQSTSGYAGDGALARQAQSENVRDVAIDGNGNLYLSDGNSAGSSTTNNIRMIYVGGSSLPIENPAGATPQFGYIYTVVGSYGAAITACPTPATFSGDGGPSTAAKINAPYAEFFDSVGNFYFTDSCNGRLRVIVNSVAAPIPNVSSPVVGNIYTVAGGGASAGPVSGVAATSLSIPLMQSAGIDLQGNLYVVDSTNKYIWQINAKTGIAVQIGGIGTANTAATLGNPCAGTGKPGQTSTDAYGDGCPALQAQILPNLRLTFDSYGHMYSVENSAAFVRQYSLGNLFPATAVGTTPVVQPTAFIVENATTLSTETVSLQGAATTEFAPATGSSNSCTVGSAIAAGTICTFYVQFAPLQAGVRSGSLQFTSTGAAGSLLLDLGGVGKAAEASIDTGTQTTLVSGTTAQGVAVDLLGNTYVSDGTNNQVLKIAAGGTTSAVLMTGLKQPHQIAVDNAGNVYVADTGNNRIAMVATGGGTVTSVGTGLAAPQGVAVDLQGNVYVADTGNNRVVEIYAAGGQITLTTPATLTTALSGPTQLAFDPVGDLYIADTGNSRVVELPFDNNATVVTLGTTAITPVGVATDAAGDLYVSDAAGEQVLELLAGTTTVNTEVSLLKAASGLAVDINGSIYVADTGLKGVVELNRAVGAIGFTPTNVGQSSNASIIVSNDGNAALNFSLPLTTATGVFSVAPATSNGCAAGSPLASATNCLLTATFTPTVKGPATQTISFGTSAANNGAVTAVLSGTGVQLVVTTMAIAVTQPTGTIAYGTPVTVTATLTLTTPSGTPTGTVTLQVDGKNQAPQAYGTGVYTITLNSLTVGSHTVVATFSGDSVYASSTNSVTFTVVKATTSTVLTVTPSAPGGSSTLAFTATVTSPTATGETGYVSFFTGTPSTGTLLTSLPIGANGSVTYTSSALYYAVNSFYAVYNQSPNPLNPGYLIDQNFNSSTSVAVKPPVDFAISTSSSSVAIFQGGVASVGVTVTPLFGATGTVSMSCSSLPANSLCRFQPAAVALDGADAVSETVEIYTNVSTATAGVNGWSMNSWTMMLGGALLGCGILLLRRRKTIATATMMLAGLLMAVTGATGCSSGSNGTALVTPAGTQTITVTFASTGATTETHSVNFSFTVNSGPF